jgi:hypothetical protein
VVVTQLSYAAQGAEGHHCQQEQSDDGCRPVVVDHRADKGERTAEEQQAAQHDEQPRREALEGMHPPSLP